MTLTVDEASYARAAWSWALDPDHTHLMNANLDRLSRDALVEVTLAADQLLAEACKRIREAEVQL